MAHHTNKSQSMLKTHSAGQLLGPSTRILPLESGSSRATTRAGTLDDFDNSGSEEPTTFFEAFGPIGLPLLLAAGVSFFWTAWLIVLGITPNRTANFLMDTTEFDDGKFWLIADPDINLMIGNTTGLGVLALSYLYALLSMAFWQKIHHQMGPIFDMDVVPGENTKTSSMTKHVEPAKVLWVELTGFNGRYRKYWNVFFKTGDFVFELIQLYRFMEEGFSASLCYGYAVLLAVNSLSQAYFIFRAGSHSAFMEVLVDTVFDMIFAVAYPILLLCYAYNSFTMDRARAHLYQKIFPPGSIQLQVRLQANPIETTIFRSCFDSLRTLSWGSLIVRLVMNASFSFRLYRLIVVIQQRRKEQRVNNTKTAKVVSQRPVPRWVGGLFTALSVTVVTYCVKSITASQSVCEAYPQCVIFAYRWNPVESCPCIALVDVDRAPKTYEEWLHPADATALVTTLTMSGDLQVLQLMNRRLKTWPEELQRCSSLQYLSLYYTGAEIIPGWARSFRKLEILILQGRKGDRNIVEMPPDLFKDMDVLTYFRFGLHQQLLELPSFEGLECLESMSLAVLPSVTSLPSLTPLTDLDRLELVSMTSLRELPDVTANTRLIQMVVTRAPLCCNGFLGVCNASSPMCSGMTASQCSQEYLADRPNKKSLAIISTHPAVCDKNQPGAPVTSGPTQAQVDTCGGIMYRQCHVQGDNSSDAGMCYNDLFQVIACSTKENVIYARRQEILLHIGPACNPTEEAWLGCT